MTDAGRGVIDLDLDDDKVKRKLKGLDKGVGSAGNKAGTSFGSGFTSSVGSSLAGLGRIVGAAGLAAAAGLGAVAAAAGGWGLKIAADNETAAVSFELLLGSGEKAQSFLSDLKGFAARTPFEFPELRTAASQLLAVGVNADRVIPIMETLGDSTAAMGTGAEGIQRAVRALTQMEQKGKVTAEEMLQLTEAGIPAWDALASVMGVSVTAAQEKVSTGTVKATELFQALEQKAGPALQRVTGLMDKQSETLLGMLSTLKDTVSQNLGDQMKPLADALKGLLPDITKLAGALAITFGGTAANLAGPLVEAFTTLAKVIDPVVGFLGAGFEDVFTGLAGGLAAIAPGLAAFVEAFSGLGEVVGPIFEVLGGTIGRVMQGLAPVLESLVAAVKPLIPILGEALLGALKAMEPIWPVLSDAIKELSPLISELATALGKELVDVFKELVPVMIENAPMFVELAEAVLELLIALLPIIGPLTKLAGLFVKFQGLQILVLAKAIGALADAVGAVTRFDFAGAWNKITAAISGFVRTVGEQLPKVINFFKELPGKIVGALSDLGTKLIPKGIELLGGFLLGLVQGIPRLIGFMIALPFVLIRALINLQQVLIPKAIAFIAGFLVGMARKLPDLVRFMVELPGKLLGKLVDLGQKLIPKGIELISGFLIGMIRKLPDVIAFVTRLPGQFVDALGAIGKKMLGVGRSLVEGIWEGIKAAAGWLKDKIGGFIGDVVGGFMDAIKGGSPSKLFADTVGRSIGEGIGLGIEKHTPKSVPIPAVPDMQRQLASMSFPVGALNATTGPTVQITGDNFYQDDADLDRMLFKLSFRLASAA